MPAWAIPCKPHPDHAAVEAALNRMRGLQGTVTLSQELTRDLHGSGFAWVRRSTAYRLSKWCHPQRWTRRERDAQPVARKLSGQLFGYTMARMSGANDEVRPSGEDSLPGMVLALAGFTVLLLVLIAV